MRKILVIDDDQPFRQILRAALESGGYKTVQAGGFLSGVQAAAELKPDLIVCDVEMPDGSGYEVLEALRQDPATSAIPFIFVTGNMDPHAMKRSMEKGADAYLTKPFEAKSLLATVEARLRRQERLLAQSEYTERRLKAIVEATPDLVCMADVATQHLLYLNRAGRRMLHLTEEEDCSGLTLPDMHAKAAREVVGGQAIPMAVEEGKWIGESALLSREGREIPVSEVVVAHKAEDGRLEFLSVIAHDMTERKRVEEERRRIESELRHAQKLESIGQLAAGIAHEINTPTQFIGDNIRFTRDACEDLHALHERFCELLNRAKKEGFAPELTSQIEGDMERLEAEELMREVPLALEQTLTGVQRVAKIVQAMKEFSHPGGERKTLIDLNHAIESTLTVCRNEWKYVAEMQTDFDLDLPLVLCHPGEINQVILNIVVNAAHAIADFLGKDAKGTIKVSTRRNSEWVEIRIVDTGGGIPEGIRDRIFDPFFTTKEVGRGTGQGLSIARSVVVDRHGGELTFETIMGEGTTFIIRLPLAAERKPES